MLIEIFNFAFGPYPQRLNIYLAEKQPTGVALTLYDAPNEAADMPPSAIKALTPMGSLPILRDADGTVIGQSLAILEYIEDKVPERDMRGRNPSERALVRQLMHMFDEALTFFGLWAGHGSQLGEGVARLSQDVTEICAGRYFAQLRVIDRIASPGPFLAGKQVTIADCVAMATLQYTDDFYGVPIPPDCVNLRRWFGHFSLRNSAARPPYPQAQLAKAHGLMKQTRVSY